MPDTPAAAPGPEDLADCRTRADFGLLLARLRGGAGLSIRDVSAATGIPSATLGDYFNGRHAPPPRDRTLERILDACGVTDPALVAVWTAARDRVRPTPGRPTANAPAPYRGLAFFRTEDAAWFFGGQDLTERLGRSGPQSRGPADGGVRAVWSGQVLAAARRADPGSGPGHNGHRDHPRRAPGPGARRRAAARRAGDRGPRASDHRGPVRGGVHARRLR